MEVAIEGRAVARAQQIRAAITLGKPGIAAFITMAAVAAYVVAGGGVPSARFFHVIVATMLVASGAAALNQVREAEVDGQPITDDAVYSIVELLISGGVGTTASLVSQTLVHLYEHPDQRTRLAEHPELLDRAVEERRLGENSNQ